MTDNQQPNLAFKPLKEDENYLIYSIKIRIFI